MSLSFDILERAVRGTAAAFRCRVEHQPAGGEGDKIFPATYAGGEYAVEHRILPGEPDPVQCVLLDSVQSQANRMELALLEAWEAGNLSLPVLTLDFAGNGLDKDLKVTSLEAPHRIADALLRDSLHDGKRFRESPIGQTLDHVDLRNATALFHYNPTALVFGMWDSTGPRGGLGAKFPRAVVSEIVGIHAAKGKRTSSRIDPASILREAGPIYAAAGGEWTLDEKQARTEKNKPVKLGKDGRPSEANHGNVVPTIADGGFTIRKALQTTVLSLPTLRRLRFPLNGKSNAETDAAARTTLAALALTAATLLHEQGCDLRSRCQLFPTQPPEWELLDDPGKPPARFSLTGTGALELFRQSLEKARSLGLPWQEKEVALKPTPQLVALVKKSQHLAAAQAGADE